MTGKLDAQAWFRDARRALGAARADELWQEGLEIRSVEAVTYALSRT